MSEEIKKEDSDVVHAFYVVYNKKTDQYGVIGSPGFFDDKARAFFALREAERNIQKFYDDKDKIGNRIITAGKNFMSKQNFRNFIRKN